MSTSLTCYKQWEYHILNFGDREPHQSTHGISENLRAFDVHAETQLYKGNTFGKSSPCMSVRGIEGQWPLFYLKTILLRTCGRCWDSTGALQVQWLHELSSDSLVGS